MAEPNVEEWVEGNEYMAEVGAIRCDTWLWNLVDPELEPIKRLRNEWGSEPSRVAIITLDDGSRFIHPAKYEGGKSYVARGCVSYD